MINLLGPYPIDKGPKEEILRVLGERNMNHEDVELEEREKSRILTEQMWSDKRGPVYWRVREGNKTILVGWALPKLWNLCRVSWFVFFTHFFFGCCFPFRCFYDIFR